VRAARAGSAGELPGDERPEQCSDKGRGDEQRNAPPRLSLGGEVVVEAGCVLALGLPGHRGEILVRRGGQASPAAFFTSLMNACSLSLTRTPPKPRNPPSFDASAAFSATLTIIAL